MWSDLVTKVDEAYLNAKFCNVDWSVSLWSCLIFSILIEFLSSFANLSSQLDICTPSNQLDRRHFLSARTHFSLYLLVESGVSCIPIFYKFLLWQMWSAVLVPPATKSKFFSRVKTNEKRGVMSWRAAIIIMVWKNVNNFKAQVTQNWDHATMLAGTIKNAAAAAEQ